MRTESPAILVVSTHARTQISRLAFRFWKYGCRVSAICPQQSELRLAMHIDRCFSFSPSNPLASLRRAIQVSGAEYLLAGDDLAFRLAGWLALRDSSVHDLVQRSFGAASAFPVLKSRHRRLAFAASLGIPTASTVPFTHPDEVSSSPLARHFPLLLKRDGTSAGDGLEVAGDLTHLPAAYARATAQRSLADGLWRLVLAGDTTGFVERFGRNEAGFCAQPIIAGVPVKTMFACWQGRLLGSVQARVLASEGATRPALLVELIQDERITWAAQMVAARFEMTGFFGMDFVCHELGGEPCLVDVNPRCTQVGHLQQAAQPDLAGLLWAQWTGRPAPEPEEEPLGRLVGFYPFQPDRESSSQLPGPARWDIAGDDLFIGGCLLREQKGWHVRVRAAIGAALHRQSRRRIEAQGVHYFKHS